MKKAFYKYFGIIFLGVFPVLIAGVLRDSFVVEYFLNAVLFVIIFSFVFSVFLALLEVKVFAGYYSNLNKVVAKLFNAEIESEFLSKTKIKKYDIYILINRNSNYPIEFHIPRSQIDKMKHKPNFKFQDSAIDDLSTYMINACTRTFLKRNKHKIEKRINEVSRYK